jgi:deoxyribonuclease (pyrimidine dimer)
MTRINAGVSPTELHRRHLIAEYREIPMVPAALRRALRTRTPAEILKGIPTDFTLNKGHVTFFFDKLTYLLRRYCEVRTEMLRRGYQPDDDRPSGFHDIPLVFYGDWLPPPEARELILERIAQRQAEKPHLYQPSTGA